MVAKKLSKSFESTLATPFLSIVLIKHPTSSIVIYCPQPSINFFID
jgi:hypothetical protein